MVAHGRCCLGNQTVGSNPTLSRVRIGLFVRRCGRSVNYETRWKKENTWEQSGRGVFNFLLTNASAGVFLFPVISLAAFPKPIMLFTL